MTTTETKTKKVPTKVGIPTTKIGTKTTRTAKSKVSPNNTRTIDAAVAAVATLCVVEPHMTGIGGDCYCLVSKPGKPVWGYNGSGRSGAAAMPSTSAVASSVSVVSPVGCTSAVSR